MRPHVTEVPKEVIHVFDHIGYPLPPSALSLKMECWLLARHLILNKTYGVSLSASSTKTQKDFNKSYTIFQPLDLTCILKCFFYYLCIYFSQRFYVLHHHRAPLHMILINDIELTNESKTNAQLQQHVTWTTKYTVLPHHAV